MGLMMEVDFLGLGHGDGVATVRGIILEVVLSCLRLNSVSIFRLLDKVLSNFLSDSANGIVSTSLHTPVHVSACIPPAPVMITHPIKSNLLNTPPS